MTKPQMDARVCNIVRSKRMMPVLRSQCDVSAAHVCVLPPSRSSLRPASAIELSLDWPSVQKMIVRTESDARPMRLIVM